jgi:type II secretory pathway component PulF
VSVRVLATLTQQLADLLGGGLPLLSALNLLAKQVEPAALQPVVEAVANAVRDGRALSEALAEHPRVFPALYRSMVKAGEASGTLEQTLARLAELGEHEAEMRSRLVSAAAYPVFVLCVAAAMSVFLLAYVIPTIAKLFVDSDQLLPLPTRILLTISSLSLQWWWAWLLAGAALVIGARAWYTSPAGKQVVDRLIISVPVVGMLVRKLETARLTRNLGTMVGQGVPILQALEMVAANVVNATLRQAIGAIREAVQQGSGLAAAMTMTKQFPTFVSNMVAVGEEAGTVDEALVKVAVTYERAVDRTLRSLTSVLEPVLLLVVGGMVLFIVLAMLLPVFQIGLVVQ